MPGSEHEMGIWGDYIREVDPSGETVWQWNGWEHMEIEQYPLPHHSNRHEFAHPNTIVALDDGNALICFRHISMIAIVDRATGEFAWHRQDLSWGGPHDIQFLDNGNMMIFANGDGRRPRGSKVIEFEQQSGDTIWQYQGNPSHTFDSFFISGCQRLWSGNTLICEGIWGRIFEVTPEGDLVWEYINPFTGPQTGAGSLGRRRQLRVPRLPLRARRPRNSRAAAWEVGVSRNEALKQVKGVCRGCYD